MRTYKTGRDFQPPQCLFHISILYNSSLKWKTPSLHHLGLPLSSPYIWSCSRQLAHWFLRTFFQLPDDIYSWTIPICSFICWLILSGFYPSLLSHRWLTGLLLPFICHRIFQSPGEISVRTAPAVCTMAFVPLSPVQVFHLNASRTDSVLPAALLKKRLLSHG